MPKDNSKFLFNGKEYPKGRLVLAVVKDFINRNQPTLHKLREAFPKSLQGSIGVFCTEQEYLTRKKNSNDKKERFFSKQGEELSVDDQRIFVCTEWGIGNIESFIEQARNLGSVIDIASDSPETPKIWKVSHSPSVTEFNATTLEWLKVNNVLALHKTTGNGSVDAFEKMKKGDIVSLGLGNTVFRLVRIISDIEYIEGASLSTEWLMRRYEIIKGLDTSVKYTGENKRWSPRYPGTSWEVPKNEYWMFEEEILQPYYDLSLKYLGFDTSKIKKPQKTNMLVEIMDKSPLNQILYGPPGTGKTYHSIQAAVKAAEPEMFNALGIDESAGATVHQRVELTHLYKDLYDSGRIRFVTFHQSYGYEEFVEGLKASSDDGIISYDVEDGVFKSISIQAEKFSKPKKAESNYSFEKAWQLFTEKLSEEEFIEVQMSKTSFRVLDFNNSRIFFEKKSGSQDHTLSISTLKAIFEERREYNSGLGVYYRPLVKYLKELSEPEQISAIERQNFVLIIDEINRGNISKVFGELITLIEPSKRLGQSEAIEVTLPYSGDKFSVPDNLYIIGTMNTADRSLALMDTALRRRFDFVEMMPDYNVLHNQEGLPFKVESDGFEIDLPRLLETMNDRIAALYDREHQLGHAFLMPVVKAIAADEDEKALHELKNCFQNKIIPLLAEYFFEDWQKVRLVLGDNQKPDNKNKKEKNYQIIRQSDVDFEKLFGDTEDVGDIADDLQGYKLIEADSDLWIDPLTYVGIYSAGSLPKLEG